MNVSSILVFREAAKDIFKMVYKEDNDDDDLHYSVKTLVQQLEKETLQIALGVLLKDKEMIQHMHR